VRLGNIWGSRGSVIPRFREQLSAGSPLTVTDRRAKRFFMTFDEAVSLVLAALELGGGNDILVPELEPAVSIADIADRLAGTPGSIQFTGLRPGDKLSEALVFGFEIVETAHPRVRRVVGPRPSAWEALDWIADLAEAVRRRDPVHLLKRLEEILPDYHPSQVFLSQVANAALAQGERR
jgi:FlaA1/EpsC-like NDP-sugar epimerase